MTSLSNFLRLRSGVFSLLLLAANFCGAENWPRFRGPTGQGVSAEKGFPLHWGADSNLAWKTEIPGQGWSSPIVWEKQIFVTSATDNGVSCRLICLDAQNGGVLWNREVFQQKPERKEGKNSYATPTPVTDGSSVFAVFGDGSLVAVDRAGKTLWTNRSYKFYSRHGLGASPILYRDLVIMPYDGSNVPGPDAPEGVGWKTPWDKAYIVALDKKTGRERWKALRGQSRIAHVTPNLARVQGRDQLVSGAGDVVQGFDPDTGQKLWWIFSKGEGVVPSIVVSDRFVYSASGYEQPTIRAIRLTGPGELKGEVTPTHLAWEQNKAVPSLSSFIHAAPYLYTITDAGIVSCLKDDTGEIVWQERIGGNHSASPVWADGKIYFLSEQGESAVIEAGATFKLLAKNQINDKCQASMAFSNGKIFIRSEKNLFAFGGK